ncbi:MAG: AraC family ligand binding domain-containing protein, partial [Treponema sp.]|nr:AraC family ligand binding domain-containing protein [Treponema sp.]
MKYLISDNADSLIHVSSGQLLNQKNFVHKRRNLDTFVIIICIKGILYIAQDDQRYTLTENQFLILFSGHEHYGYRECSEDLSYYWCHFRIQDDKFRIIRDKEMEKIFDANVLTRGGGGGGGGAGGGRARG